MIASTLLSRFCGYIDGRWCDADSGATMPVINPATGDTIAETSVMGRAEATRAVEAAARGLETPASLDQRRQWLEQLAELIGDHRAELGRIITHENGKPWKEAQGEADYAASFFRYYAGCLDHLRSRQLDAGPRGCNWTVHYRPAGVAALITPWNFPLAMLAKKFSAALAADCCCVVKPSSKTPLSMIALFTLLEQIGLPSGKANLVLGPAGEISEVLCEHPSVRVISFTGSTSVGRKLALATAPRLKRLALELGGNAPFIVFDDADLESATEHLLANKFRGAGQTCVCANRLYVQRSVVDRLAGMLAARVEKMSVGNGMEEGTDIGPLIDASACEKVQRHIDDAVGKGASVLVGGTAAKGFFRPTVLRGVTSDMLCVKEETFGPVVPMIEFEDEDEVIAAANQTEYGLAAYVFTADADRADRLISGLAFGHVGHNTGTGPTAECPFGGMKQSGFGREGGLEGLHDFVEPQTVPQPVAG